MTGNGLTKKFADCTALVCQPSTGQPCIPFAATLAHSSAMPLGKKFAFGANQNEISHPSTRLFRRAPGLYGNVRAQVPGCVSCLCKTAPDRLFAGLF